VPVSLGHEVLEVLGRRASKDVTPALLAACRRADPKGKCRILSALDEVWGARRFRRAFRFPSAASEEDVARWRRELASLVVESIKSKDKNTARAAISLAGSAKIAEAAEAIGEAVSPKESFGHGVPFALAAIGTDRAVDVLVRLSYATRDYERQHVIGALKDTKSERAVPRLRELLAEKRFIGPGKRACDYAADALAAILPEGPGFDIEAAAADRDKAIENWKKRLAGLSGRGPAAGQASGSAARRLKLAEKLARDGLAPQALGQLLAAEGAVARTGDARALAERIAKMKSDLTGQEVRAITRGVRMLHADTGHHSKQGKGPDYSAPDALKRYLQGQFTIGKNRYGPYARLDERRFDEQGRYLDAWGRPYVLVHPARHGKGPIDVYSAGPNGLDERGAGDDITGW